MLYENTAMVERVILVAVAIDDVVRTEQSLDELQELADTAGAETVGRLIQSRDKVHTGTYLGKGKLQELAIYIEETQATGVIVDDELSPAQMLNMQDALQTKVIDRTLLILDIFAKRAQTREGKIQVELAQLRYRLSRLAGLGSSLSRQGGGIGSKGPGEKKLELDRRLVRSRISQLKVELEDIKRHREVARQQRARGGIPVVAIVGYTNAGKSTLLNRLTAAGVLEEDQLFATLDPTTRSLMVGDGQEILLTDTVGFIDKLPHHLVDAFRSTLEEAKYADILIHMVDASHPQMELHMHVVYETLDILKVQNKKLITVFNKMDLLDSQNGAAPMKDFRADETVMASMKTGDGVEDLIEALRSILREKKLLIERVFDYNHVGDIAVIRKYGQLLEERYQEDGIFVRAYVDRDVYAQLEF